MDTAKKKESGRLRFIRQAAAIALPVALQNLLMTTQSIVDTMMLAPMGEKTIASVGLCAQYAALMFASYWGFACGGTLFFSQYWGAKDEAAIKKNYGVTLVCMMSVGVLFSFAAFFEPELIMRLYTDKESLHSVGISYLRILAPAYMLQIYAACMSALLRATEQVKIPFYAGCATTLSNISLNYILIYGKFGMPAMGADGAAVGTLAASVINVLLIWTLAGRSGHQLIFEVHDHFRWSRGSIKIYLSKCFPIICNEVFMGIGNMAISMVMGRQSEHVIAALVVFRALEACIVAFFMGLSNAASVLVGKSVGAGEIGIAIVRAKRLVVLCACTIAAAEAVIFAGRAPIFHAMGLHGEAFEICEKMWGIYSIAAILRMSNWIQNDTFRSAGDAAFGTILEISFMYLLVLPVVCVTGLVLRADPLFVFAACYIDEPIRLALMLGHLHSSKWIKPVTERGKKALGEALG